MAVITFTSNAATGAGSLAEAVKNAQPGDVVRPDETVFERGSTIEIVLAGRLSVDKNLTLDATPFRVRLNGGGAVQCVAVASGANATFTSFDFVFGKAGSGAGTQVLANATATFNRCLFAGCDASYGGAVNASAGTTVALNDCAVVGCRGVESGGGVLSAGALNLNGVTAVGCVSGRRSDVSVYGGGVLTARNSILGNVVNTTTAPSTFLGSVVDVASSNVGFVASPPDGLTVEDWDANVWQSWDLRLLDDMSPNPSPYRDSGDVGAMSQYDLQGNFRGREINGATSCSPGAYETIQADLFWIGRDATGAEVETPSWFASDGWAASRFATVSGDKEPQSSDSVFIDGAIVLESNVLQLKKLTVGGAASLTLDDSESAASQNMRVGQIDLGVGATVLRVADKQRLQISNPSAVSRFGDYCYTAPLFFWNNAEALSIAPTAKFTSVVSAVKLYNNGIYNAYNLQVSDVATLEGDSTGCVGVYITFLKPTARLAVAGAARVFCNEFKWTTPSDATSDFKGLADGSTPIVFAPSRSATVDGVGSVDDFIVDVSNARTTGTLALTLSGQTVCGDAPTGAAVSLTGSAKIADRDLTSPTFSVGAGSSLTFSGAQLKTQSLTSLNGSRFDGRGRVEFPSNGRWTNEGATLNGVAAEDYDAASNDIKIVCRFDASEIRNAFNDGFCRWTSEALDAGTLPFVFSKYGFDAQGQGDYRTIYDTSQPVDDATSSVYETAFDWNGETLKTVVHATPEAGWNYYRVEVPKFANLGGAKIYHDGQTTRYFVFWNADYEPEATYYYCGGATGSFTKTSDWALTDDGVAKFEGAPTSAGAVFVVNRSARLRDFPDDSLQTLVVFPSVVDVYNSNNRRLSDAEARLVSVGVPTPAAPEFYVGKGGTSGFWKQCDGATLYRVEALDGSATGLTASNRWLDANELKTKTWRVRVAAPIYGGVEKWSTQATAVQPFSALVEKSGYDDATAGTTFELVYTEGFDGVRDASIARTRKSDAASTILAQNFDGGEFNDAPSTFDEYVYRVSWTPSPENVWLETTAAPWLVADGFDATSQINFITTPSRAYETPTFAARVAKKSNGELLKRQEVAEISYSLFETRDFGATRAERLAVGSDGSYWRHNVEIPAATVRDSLLVDPNFWSLDEIGANFVFSPNDGRPFFPRPGAYLVRATLETTNGRRIVVEFPAQVE